jgi:hypothetical protein
LKALKSGESAGTSWTGRLDNNPATLYWSECEKISNLQRHVLVHSIIYYHMNQNIIADKQYDDLARELYRRSQDANREALEKTTYWYIFKNFHPSSGYYLLNRMIPEDKSYVTMIARQVLFLKSREEANAKRN